MNFIGNFQLFAIIIPFKKNIFIVSQKQKKTTSTTIVNIFKKKSLYNYPTKDDKIITKRGSNHTFDSRTSIFRNIYCDQTVRSQ